jgi:hypothetical protein
MKNTSYEEICKEQKLNGDFDLWKNKLQENILNKVNYAFLITNRELTRVLRMWLRKN